MAPALILLLARKWLPVSVGDMFLSVIKIILIPIVLGLVAKVLFRKQVEQSVKAMPLVSVIAIVCHCRGGCQCKSAENC